LLPKSAAGTPRILIGTLKGKPRMSRLTAQYADMWNCMIAFGDCAVATYDQAWAPIRAACERIDRDPASLSQGATVAVNFTSDPYPIVPTSTPFSGTIKQLADRFAEYASRGVEHVSTVPHPWNEDGLDRLAAVIEHLRA
jgi:alkanesulfonate monooxygenase SsuD/methylene tetrahydromethanopterin reductase-like flavin-dependent oxidoreductase (luciferase family)